MKKRMKYLALVLSLIAMIGIKQTNMYCGKIYTNLDDYIDANREEIEAAGYVYDDGSGTTSTNTQKPNEVTPSTPEKKVVKSCDHTYETTVVKEATCKDEGELKFVCSQCGDTYTQKTSATGEHKYESVITKEATCTESGIMTYTCTGCGDSYTEDIPATGHKYEPTITKAATCVVPGEQLYKCSICDDEYTEEIPATGHVPGETKVTKKAGLFTPGEKVSVCATCGETLNTEVIPSQYPITYLYIIIGAILAITVVVILTIVKKRRYE